MEDIYFEERYCKLFEAVEKGDFQIYNFHNEFGEIRHLFIKRKIPFTIAGKQYFDLVTPYGYGGPQILQCETGMENQLVKAFESDFQQYCLDQDIVSEFIRFHPLSYNAQDFLACYEVAYLRETVGTNLTDDEQAIEQEFSKSAKKNIRQALKAGVEYRCTLNPRELGAFKSIYYATMDRNDADAFYYFKDDYFADLTDLLGEHLLLIEVLYEGEVIGAALNFVYNNLAHTHLSGTLVEFNRLSPASILYYALVLWGEEHGIDYIHGGGGRTNRPDDKLYLFKKQFGIQTGFHFYIGRKIWNKNIYDELCDAVGVEEETEFFPAYRSVAINEYEHV